MTKKEQSQLDQLRVSAALGWPKFEKPAHYDHPEYGEEGYGRVMECWFAYPSQVLEGWSASASHGHGPLPVGYAIHASQGSGRPFLTKLDALKMLRWERCEEFARALAGIDAQIEKEMGS